jgi:hypothetical protein
VFLFLTCPACLLLKMKQSKCAGCEEEGMVETSCCERKFQTL